MKNCLALYIMTRKRIHFCRVFYVFFYIFWWTTRSRNFQVYFTFCSKQWWSSAHLSEFAHFFASTHHSQRGFLRNKNLVRLAIVHIKIFIFAREPSINHVTNFLSILTPPPAHSWSLLQYKSYVIKWPFSLTPYPLSCPRGLWMTPRKKLTWHSNHALDSVRVLRITITNWDCWICWVS